MTHSSQNNLPSNPETNFNEQSTDILRPSRLRNEKISLPELFGALMAVTTPDGIQASTWDLYHGAIFGRDSEHVALDLVPWIPSISDRVIFSLIRFQGSKSDVITEEEEGRIHHEYRHLFVGGKKVGLAQEKLLQQLSSIWGGSDKEMIYYGTVDATPQLVRLVAQHCRYYGPSILETEFIHRNGQVRTVKESVLLALSWIVKRIESSSLHLLEFQRTNPNGIRWQVMRDGVLAYMHKNGDLANSNAPIASLEVQALAYDALVLGGELFISQIPEQAKKWQEIAQALQKSVFERFWMKDQNFFRHGY